MQIILFSSSILLRVCSQNLWIQFNHAWVGLDKGLANCAGYKKVSFFWQRWLDALSIRRCSHSHTEILPWNRKKYESLKPLKWEFFAVSMIYQPEKWAVLNGPTPSFLWQNSHCIQNMNPKVAQKEFLAWRNGLFGRRISIFTPFFIHLKHKIASLGFITSLR